MNTYPPTSGDPNQSPDSKEQKVNIIWKVVTGIYFLVSIGIILYWAFKDEGLPQYICELQARLFDSDSCYIALNFIGSIFVFLIPVIVGKYVVEKISGVKIHSKTYR